jgi:hypothetical protein
MRKKLYIRSSLLPGADSYRSGGDYLWYLFVVAFFYIIYRYPFRINEDLASSGYTVTPLVLKLGKYVLVLIILGWALLRNSLNTNPRVQRGTYLVLAAAYGFIILSAVVVGTVTNEVRLSQVAVFLLIPFVVHLFALPTIDPSRIYTLIKCTAIFALLFNALVILLYVTIGRLPALAYRGTVSIRFGSYLDDPNGFGILLSCLIPFSWFAFSGIGRYIMVLGLFGSLALTQSLSGILGVVVAMLLLILVRTLRDPSPGRVLLFCVLVISAGAAILKGPDLLDTPITREVMKLKQGSVNIHFSDFARLFDLRPAAWLGIDPTGELLETSYAETIQNYGAVFLLTLLAIRVYACRRYYVAMLRPQEPTACVAVWSAFFCYLVCTFVVGFILPIERSFPTNMLLILIMTLGSMDGFTRSRRESNAAPLHLQYLHQNHKWRSAV